MPIWKRAGRRRTELPGCKKKGNLRFSPAAASESKVFGTELVQRMADLSIEIMGFPGNLEGSQWAPMHSSMIEDLSVHHRLHYLRGFQRNST